MSIQAPVELVGYDYRTASRYTGVSERYLRDEKEAGRLKAFMVGNRVRFHREDLDAWLDMLREEEAQRQQRHARRRRRRERAA